MKKLTKTITLILLLGVIIISAMGCSIFNGSNGKDNSGDSGKEKTETITVYNGDTPITYTAKHGDIVEIDVTHKKGYYFLGAWDEKEGGTKYFDCVGESTMVWGEGMPTTFYIRYDDIANLSYGPEIKFEEDPQSTSGGSGLNIKYDLNDEMINAIEANLDAKLKIDVALAVTCDVDWEFYEVSVQNLTSGGEKNFLGGGIKLTPGTYKELSFSTKMNAKLFKKGQVYVYIKAKNGSNVTARRYYYKNVSVAISFDV